MLSSYRQSLPQVQIAQILGASIYNLLGMKAPPARSSGASIENRRLQEIEKLPRRDQEALLRTIEAFIAKAD